MGYRTVYDYFTFEGVMEPLLLPAALLLLGLAALAFGVHARRRGWTLDLLGRSRWPGFAPVFLIV